MTVARFKPLKLLSQSVANRQQMIVTLVPFVAGKGLCEVERYSFNAGPESIVSSRHEAVRCGMGIRSVGGSDTFLLWTVQLIYVLHPLG